MAPRILLCCVLLGLAGCGEESGRGDGSAPGGPAPATQLTVRVDPDGKGPEPAKQARISCDADGKGKGCAAAAGLRAGRLRADRRRHRLHGAVRRPADRDASAASSRGERVEGSFARQQRLRDRPLGKLAALLEQAG